MACRERICNELNRRDYSLRIAEGFSIAIPLELSAASRNPARFEILKLKLGTQDWFRSDEGRSAVQMKASSFKRLIAWALEEQMLERLGGGPGTLYRFTG
jgi:hypothetical protein